MRASAKWAAAGWGRFEGTLHEPEQARGKPVDKRSDIFSFGCVLYEMVAGRRAFEGEAVTDLLAAVLTRAPQWDDLPKGVGPTLRRVLSRCLEKNPSRRYRDIGDVAYDLAKAPDAECGQVSYGDFVPLNNSSKGD
jgi:serine/threonine protein kinase